MIDKNLISLFISLENEHVAYNADLPRVWFEISDTNGIKSVNQKLEKLNCYA